MSEDPILTAAREFAMRFSILEPSDRFVRALHAFALKQRAEGVREAARSLRISRDYGLYEIASHIESQAKEIEP